MMHIKKMRIYSLIGMNLGGVTVIFTSFIYRDFLVKYLDAEAMLAILTLIAAIQGLLASLIYRSIKEHFPKDQIIDMEHSDGSDN